MNYQTFIKQVMDELSLIFPEDYQMTVSQITKNNSIVLDALTIMRPGANITPTIYLNPYYHRYLNKVPFEDILEDILEVYHRYSPPQNIDLDAFFDYAQARKHIVVRLINYEQNRELLKDCPHVPFLDLAIVFRYQMDHEFLGNGSILIHNEQMHSWDISIDRIYQDALLNTTSLLSPQLDTLYTTLQNNLKEIGQTADDYGLGLFTEEEDCPLYVLTNTEKQFGAATLIYPRLLHRLAKEFDSDLVLLPSSVHEILLLPVKQMHSPVDLNDLSEMVREINRSELQDEEVLSDSAYLYSLESGIMTNGRLYQEIL